jgi:hypothetical protein
MQDINRIMRLRGDNKEKSNEKIVDEVEAK